VASNTRLPHDARTIVRKALVPLLAAAGFDVATYEEPPDWQRQQRTLMEGIIASELALTDEIEPAVVAGFVAMARGVLADLPWRRCGRRRAW
jgi:hypothetical protein